MLPSRSMLLPESSVNAHVEMNPEQSSVVEQTSRSSTSSPTSHKTAIDSQTTQSSVPVRTELTPPSSIASSQEEQVVGKKRTADGEVKYRHRSTSASSAMTELSQSLKMKLSYAMVKVQNGWQSNTLDEVESLASQSPRSFLSGNRNSTLVSPRVALAATMRSQLTLEYDPPVPGAKLAPSATITPRKRANLQVNTMKPPRPISHRTPSQNAAMEADAVETLLFMSASPNNSGRFPATFSPISQTFSTQTSPLRSQFSPSFKRPNRIYEDKSVLIDRLLSNLDDDMNDELDEAMRILDQHRATKLVT